MSCLIQKASRRATDRTSKTTFLSFTFYVLTIIFEIMKTENAAVSTLLTDANLKNLVYQ